MYNIQKTILKSQSLSQKRANAACDSQKTMYFTKEKSLSFENDRGSQRFGPFPPPQNKHVPSEGDAGL